MTWQKIAKKDFRDAVQSRALWALVGVFGVVSLITPYAYVEAPELFGEPGGATFGGLMFMGVGLLGLYVPLAAIVVCYKSLAGERESGSIKLLLSLPTTRKDVLVGKVVGRASVLIVGLGVGLVVGLGFGAVLIGQFSGRGAFILVAVTGGFILVYGSIMVGISALSGSTTKATTFALGFFVVVELLWEAVTMGVVYILGGFQMPVVLPAWGIALMQLSPSTAYFSAVIASLPADVTLEFSEPGRGDAGVGESFFVSPEFGYVVLLFWLVAPLTVGYYRFTRADL